MSDDLTLGAALSYIAHGWHVFPCCWPDQHSRCACGRGHSGRDVGKAPITTHGLHDASADESTVRRWWGQTPRANIAIRTGAVSNLVVLDVDSDKGGEDSLVALEGKCGLLPETIESQTGGGGRHVLFAHPGGDMTIGNATNLGGYVGLDVRGDGGYIIAAPSLHVSGRRYRWEVEHLPEDVPLAAMPDWLLAMMVRPAPRTAAPVAKPSGVGWTEISRAAEALGRLAPFRCESYEDWVQVGMSLTPLGDMGLALWDQWSQTCAGKYQPGACAEKWRTFQRNGVGIGSLIHWAETDSPSKPGDVVVRGFRHAK